MHHDAIDPLPIEPPPAEPIPAPEPEEEEEEPAAPTQRLGLPRLNMGSYQPDPQVLAEFGSRCAGEMAKAKRS